jgi:thymidine kinase
MLKRTVPILLLLLTTLLPEPLLGQEERASRYYHYRSTEMSTGIYEEYEVRPRSVQNRVESTRGQGRTISRVESEENRALSRLFLDDAHQGLAFYEQRRCVDCHAQEARNNRHFVRHGITCRQCHGGEPIASSDHFFSRLNSIRKHTHVCAKCHEGAGFSFALYAVHEPAPANSATLASLPVLYYAFWIMIALAVGTFALFLPHTLLWGIRELFLKKTRSPNEQ